MDGIGGTVKDSVWKSSHAGSTVPCDATSYAETATQRNPNINVLNISSTPIQPFHKLMLNFKP